MGGGLMVIPLVDDMEYRETERVRVSCADWRGEYGGGGVSRVAVEVFP